MRLQEVDVLGADQDPDPQQYVERGATGLKTGRAAFVHHRKLAESAGSGLSRTTAFRRVALGGAGHAAPNVE
jgi:hypothetical protein